MGLSAPTEVVHLSPGVVAMNSGQSGSYQQKPSIALNHHSLALLGLNTV